MQKRMSCPTKITFLPKVPDKATVKEVAINATLGLQDQARRLREKLEDAASTKMNHLKLY